MKNFFDINEINKLLFKETATPNITSQSTPQTQDNILGINWNFLSNFFGDTNPRDPNSKASATFSFSSYLNQQNNSNSSSFFTNFAPSKNEPPQEKYQPDNFSSCPILDSLPKFDTSTTTPTPSEIQSSTLSSTNFKTRFSDPLPKITPAESFRSERSAYSGSIYPPSFKKNIDDELSQCSFSKDSSSPKNSLPKADQNHFYLNTKSSSLISYQQSQSSITSTSSPVNSNSKTSSWSVMISSSLSSLVNTISFWKKSPSYGANVITSHQTPNSSSSNTNTPTPTYDPPSISKALEPIETTAPSPVAFFGSAAMRHKLYQEKLQHRQKTPQSPFVYPRGSDPDSGKLPSRSKSPIPNLERPLFSRSRSSFTRPPSIIRQRSSFSSSNLSQQTHDAKNYL